MRTLLFFSLCCSQAICRPAGGAPLWKDEVGPVSDQFSRSRMLLGDGPQERLFHASVALFGVGGVGGFCAEALARAGIGALDLYDDDTVSESNLNRQLIALHSTLGRPKAEVMAERVRDINPACRVRALRMFYLPENAGEVDLSRYDYVVDAVDTVSAKLELAVRCQALGVPLISAMGSGNKLDPSLLRLADISETYGCPLARVMRRELRSRGIQHQTVVFSPEEPAPTLQLEAPPPGRRSVPASNPWVPATAGLLMGSKVVRELISREG